MHSNGNFRPGCINITTAAVKFRHFENCHWDSSQFSLTNLSALIYRGVNVLNTKSELERVMEKRNKNRKEQERIIEQEATKTPFQKMLEERAKRLEMIVSLN